MRRLGSYVRCNDDVWKIPELTFLRQRLDFGNIESRATQGTGLKSFRQIALDNHGTSRHVDQQTIFAHPGQLLSINQPTRRRIERQAEYHCVTLSQ